MNNVNLSNRTNTEEFSVEFIDEIVGGSSRQPFPPLKKDPESY